MRLDNIMTQMRNQLQSKKLNSTFRKTSQSISNTTMRGMGSIKSTPGTPGKPLSAASRR